MTGTPTDAALTVTGLRKRYGSSVAVADVDLTVREGEIFGILGPNGSGKTTTVECSYGLRRPDAGRIRVFDIDPQSRPDRVARLVGTQLQDSALPDHIKVREAVHLFAALSRQPVDESTLIDEWGLTAKRKATFGSLSGGQRQRLLVALALVNRPRLVFLDEMTTGLDPAARREVWELIERIRRDGTTVVLVTHFMDEAERLCDRVAVLVRGRVVAEGSPAGLVDRFGGAVKVCFAADGIDHARLRDLAGVAEVHRRAGRIEVRGTGAFLTGLGHALTVQGHGDTQLRVDRGGLEDAYVNLVQAAGADTVEREA
jgi:ABC-2 type transport system ATP-binding protein